MMGIQIMEMDEALVEQLSNQVGLEMEDLQLQQTLEVKFVEMEKGSTLF
jgi:hypothetical protein